MTRIPIGMMFLLLAIGALLALWKMKSPWVRAILGGLVLGPLTYVVIGLALAGLAPPRRVSFFSVPLPYDYYPFNMAIWAGVWGWLIVWLMRRRGRTSD